MVSNHSLRTRGFLHIPSLSCVPYSPIFNGKEETQVNPKVRIDKAFETEDSEKSIVSSTKNMTVVLLFNDTVSVEIGKGNLFIYQIFPIIKITLAELTAPHSYLTQRY